MKTLNARFALLMLAILSQPTINATEEFHAVTIGTLPGKINFNWGIRLATSEEKKYARALAKQQLDNLNKSYLRRSVENIAFTAQEIQDLTKEYVWDAQPLGIKHGGKVLIIPFTVAVSYTIYRAYKNIPLYKSWLDQGWQSCKQWNPYATYQSYKDAWDNSKKTNKTSPTPTESINS